MADIIDNIIIDGKTSLVKPHTCIHCNYKLDAATTISKGDAPKGPGKDDVSLCMGCGNIGVYEEDMSIRDITAEEYKEITEEDKRMLIKAKAYIQMIKPMQRRKEREE